ncbi:hypothetical protein C1645_811900 [Glomus cerebriforme]|uniref:Uncharacterized protein n=1 Tax=Glomus cerebriforme TaxID=658196 RepID=A0A397TLR1_9GLOM|nr:hypothetical protein C1645_811900 [Glomus cerebriforme]
MFRYGMLRQDKDSIADYYLKYIAMSGYYHTLDELVKALIQVEKETIPVLTAFSEYCRQVGIINQNLMQSIWHSGPPAMHWLVRAPESEKKKEIPAPTQEGSVKEYCEMFSLYAVASMSSGKSAENIKEKFIRGLLPAYETKATSCDSELPFDSLIDRFIIYEKNRLAGPEQVER